MNNVKHEQPSATAPTLSQMGVKGAMPPLVFSVEDCQAACERMSTCGVEFTQEPVKRFGAADAGFRDPSGNGWKMIGTLTKPHSEKSQ